MEASGKEGVSFFPQQRSRGPGGMLCAHSPTPNNHLLPLTPLQSGQFMSSDHKLMMQCSRQTEPLGMLMDVLQTSSHRLQSGSSLLLTKVKVCALYKCYQDRSAIFPLSVQSKRQNTALGKTPLFNLNSVCHLTLSAVLEYKVGFVQILSML